MRALLSPLLGPADGFPWRRAIAIAIGGLLSSLLQPNVLCFTCKSKQSEAKTNLSGLFTAEKAFFGEYNTYSTDLLSVNWAPDGHPAYVYGFARPGPGLTRAKAQSFGLTDYDETRCDSANSKVMAKDSSYSTVKMRDLNGRALSGSDLPRETTASDIAFLAGAVGDIDPDSTPSLDVWTIDNLKDLRNVNNDCND